MSNRKQTRIAGKPDVFHPDKINRRAERRCMFTVAVGDKFKWMFDITIPYMRAYCKYHDIDFIVVDDNYRVNEHPCFMKQFIQTLWWRYDRVCYVDSDVLILPGSPNIFNAVPADKCGALRVVDYSGIHGEVRKRLSTNSSYMLPYVKAYNAKMTELGLPKAYFPKDWTPDNYFNAGVFICSKDTNPHVSPPGGVMQLPTSNHYDQNFFNMMIQSLQIPMYDIGIAWNRRVGFKVAGCSSYLDGAYFIHYLGLRRKAQMVKDLNRIPSLSAYGTNVITAPDYTPADVKTIEESPRVITPSTDKPYHVQFVGATRNPPWILERMQKHIIEAAPSHVTCNVGPNPVDTPDALNYFNPYRYYTRSKFAIDVTFQTHPEVNPLFVDSARSTDAVVVMCEKYKNHLIQDGVSIDKVNCIHAGLDEVFRSAKLRVFNPTRMNHNAGYVNRKGANTWNELSKLDWLDCVCSNGKLSQTEVFEEYQKADVVVSTATMEGGPMSVLEGLAMGKVVFARKGVGLVDELCKIYSYSTDTNLIQALEMLYAKKKERADSVVDCSWAHWAEDHWNLFNRLMRNRGNKCAHPAVVSSSIKRHKAHPHKNTRSSFLRG